MSVPDILPPGDFESMMQKYKNRGEDNFDAGYWRHKKKDGTLFFVHIYAHATTFNNKDARLCFAVDVDKQLQMNRENMELMTLISEQKQQLDNLLLSITDALWTRNAHTLELMYGNNAYFKLHGYDQEEMTPNEDFAFKAIYPDDQPIIANAYKEIMLNGSADIVYRYVHKDGSLKTLKVQAVLKKGIDGKPDTINGITVDITKEKELLDKIQDSEHKLKATINNTKDLIWSVDVDLRIIFCNQPYSDFFKWLCDIDIAEGDFVLGDWRTAEFQQNRRTDYERALNGESFITEIEEVRNGELFYFEISSSPLKDSAGKVIGVNCISRNITEQKRNWHKIQRQNAKLKEIAWVQSHKVRGPVASILGLISLVNESIELEELSKVLGNMKMAGLELDAIIREVVAGTNEMEQH
jgi:PAS domain S-box-containing protein